LDRFRTSAGILLCVLMTATMIFGQDKQAEVASDSGQGAARGNGQGVDRQTGSTLPDAPDPAEPRPNTIVGLPRALLHDQLGLWSSPARLRFADATWLVPVGGLTAAFLATDSDVSRHLSNDPSTLLRYKHISDYGAYSMVGGAGGLYLLGLVDHNDHQRETGFLSGEAAIDSLAVVEAIKYATGRESGQREWQVS